MVEHGLQNSGTYLEVFFVLKDDVAEEHNLMFLLVTTEPVPVLCRIPGNVRWFADPV